MWSTVRLLGVLAMLSCASPAMAQSQADAATAGGVSIWELSAYKAVAFESAATVADLALFAIFFGGGPAAAAGFVAVNWATAGAAYYSHELVWDYFAPATEESQVRTAVAKTVTYRVVSVAGHLAIGGFYSGAELATSVAYTLAGQLADIVLYFGNETLWAKFGPRIAR